MQEFGRNGEFGGSNVFVWEFGGEGAKLAGEPEFGGSNVFVWEFGGEGAKLAGEPLEPT